MPNPFEVFCCYAREDQEMLAHLKRHLAPLQRQGQITIWSDTDINAGVEWEKELHQHLESADIILLLISPDFMDSDYCYSIEMGTAIQRHNRGEATVVPVLLRPTFWQNAPFAKLQMIPRNAKPVTNWSDRDDALHDITMQFNQIVSKLHTKGMQVDVDKSTITNRQQTSGQKTSPASKSPLLVRAKDQVQAHRIQITGWQRVTAWVCFIVLSLVTGWFTPFLVETQYGDSTNYLPLIIGDGIAGLGAAGIGLLFLRQGFHKRIGSITLTILWNAVILTAYYAYQSAWNEYLLSRLNTIFILDILVSITWLVLGTYFFLQAAKTVGRLTFGIYLFLTGFVGLFLANGNIPLSRVITGPAWFFFWLPSTIAGIVAIILSFYHGRKQPLP